MLIKFLILALSKMTLNNLNDTTSLEIKTNSFIKRTIRIEILSLSFKILIGVIITSAVVFSIIQLGKIFQTYLRLFENSNTLEIISFGLITVIGILALFLLFTNYFDKSLKSKDVKPDKTLNVENLFSNFAVGFTKGLNSKNNP